MTNPVLGGVTGIEPSLTAAFTGNANKENVEIAAIAVTAAIIGRCLMAINSNGPEVIRLRKRLIMILDLVLSATFCLDMYVIDRSRSIKLHGFLYAWTTKSHKSRRR